MEETRAADPNILTGPALTPKDIAREIRRRNMGGKIGEPYTRVEITLEKEKRTHPVSIAVSNEGVIHKTLEKESIFLFFGKKITSMKFLHGIVNPNAM